MKEKFALLALLACVALPSAMADDAPEIDSSQLTRWDVDSQLSDLHDIQAGWIKVDHGAKSVTLTLALHSSCPPGMYCALMTPAPYVVRLPILSETRNSCGGKVITASQDLRTVDGELSKLEIHDNSGDHCMHLLTAATEIVYTTEARNVSTRSVFEAGKLERSGIE